jgi:deazaflavin-dependent oxidoreductase (nitroreductase family)
VSPGYFDRRRLEIGDRVKRLLNRGVPVYRGPLASMFGRYQMLMLTTVGWRTGKPRPVVLSFMPLGDDYVVGAGLGEGCGWYRNIQADPDVTVQIGRKRFRAHAEPVANPVRRRELTERMLRYWDRYGPPRPVRWISRKWFGFDYDAELEGARAHGDELPYVILRPFE